MTGKRTTHQSLHRAVLILRTFTESDPNLTVGEVAVRTGLHKSTCSRILAALLSEGLVWHDESGGRYSLGLGLVELAGVALGQIDVRRAAMPHIERLAAELDETVSVCVLRGREAVTVAHAAGSRSVRHVVWIGRRIPLDRTASGRILLAAQQAGDQDWRSLGLPGQLAAEEQARPPGRDIDLERILATGVAVEIDDFEVGTTSVAVPVRDASGAVVAALSVGAPTDRFDATARAAAARLLARTADDIAAELGLRVEAQQ